MPLLILAVIILILLWPLIARIAHFLFVAHARLVVLFLPAGPLVRYGPSQDMRLFVAVTFAWALALFVFRICVRVTARAPFRLRSGATQSNRPAQD
jgi:hypothetical protein